MTRVTDANLLFSGHEPKFTTELTQIDLIKALSWYNQNKDNRDAFKWACDFFKKKYKLDISSVVKDRTSTFGFICRIVSNGGILPQKDQIWFDEQVESVKKELSQTKVEIKVVEKTNVINIQDRIREKANECIAELEGSIDDMISNAFVTSVAPYGIMHTLNIKDAQTKYIVDWAKSRRNEYDEVLNSEDEQLKEGYSNFNKSQLKKIINFFDQVILDCQKISGNSVKSRKPRKRKTKTPEQLVAKLNFLQKFEELNLTSVDPTEIVGALQLWVYNTKTRKLGVYHAEDASGLSIKGSTITNFTEFKSVQKKLRKPEDTLPEVLKSGKVALRNFLDTIKAVQNNLTGRINTDTILIRTVK